MRTLNDLPIYGRIDDLSTADQVYLPAPDDGYVHELFVTLANAITSADATATVKTASGTVGTVTLTQSGSAAGSTYSGTFSPNGTSYVSKGDYIEVETDGGSSTACEGTVCVILRR